MSSIYIGSLEVDVRHGTLVISDDARERLYLSGRETAGTLGRVLLHWADTGRLTVRSPKDKTVKKFKITEKRKQRARELLRRIPSVPGERKVAYMCGDCGHVFGRRFIPYGLGQGVTLNACLCQLTQRGRPTIEVMRQNCPHPKEIKRTKRIKKIK